MSDDAPTIAYPRRWGYTVIGRDAARLRAAITSVIPSDRGTITTGNTSRGGRYTSLRVELEVASAEERDALFVALKAHADTVVVF